MCSNMARTLISTAAKSQGCLAGKVPRGALHSTPKARRLVNSPHVCFRPQSLPASASSSQSERSKTTDTALIVVDSARIGSSRELPFAPVLTVANMMAQVWVRGKQRSKENIQRLVGLIARSLTRARHARAAPPCDCLFVFMYSLDLNHTKSSVVIGKDLSS